MWIALIIIAISIFFLLKKQSRLIGKTAFHKFGKNHLRSNSKLSINPSQEKIILEGLYHLDNRNQYVPQYVKGVYHFDGDVASKKKVLTSLEKKSKAFVSNQNFSIPIKMDKEQVSSWIDSNRKNIRFIQVTSFREAANIIAFDLYKIKQPTENNIQTIIGFLHGKCYCKQYIGSLPACPQCGRVVFTSGDRTASCATEPGVRELREIVARS